MINERRDQPMLITKDVKRLQRKRCLKRVSCTFGPVVFIIGIFVMLSYWNPLELFQFQNTQLVGVLQSNENSIKKIANSNKGVALFRINSTALEKEIGKLDWIKSVSVNRRIPNELLITIQEEVPVAILNRDELYLLTDQGNFYPMNEVKRMIDLPVVTNYKGILNNKKKRMNKSIKQVAQILFEMKKYKLYDQLSEIRYQNDGTYRLFLGMNTELKIGSNYKASIAAADLFLSNYSNKVKLHELAYIDAITPGFISFLESKFAEEQNKVSKL